MQPRAELTLRLPSSWAEKLKELAKAQDVSVNTLIKLRLAPLISDRETQDHILTE